MTNPERTVEPEGDLEQNLRACRKRDPNFERAIAEVVDAEITAKDDPAEGRVVAHPPHRSSPAQIPEE